MLLWEIANPTQLIIRFILSQLDQRWIIFAIILNIIGVFLLEVPLPKSYKGTNNIRKNIKHGASYINIFSHEHHSPPPPPTPSHSRSPPSHHHHQHLPSSPAIMEHESPVSSKMFVDPDDSHHDGGHGGAHVDLIGTLFSFSFWSIMLILFVFSLNFFTKHNINYEVYLHIHTFLHHLLYFSNLHLSIPFNR